MKKSSKITIWIIIFILFFIISFLSFKYEAWEYETSETKTWEYKTSKYKTQEYKRAKEPKICCNNTCFDIEIADDNESRKLWLMYRESLWDNEWMLFIFDQVWIYSFWMKNTLIPLAWIRLDSDLKIVDIIQMEPCKSEPCTSYKPKSEAQYVLEINQWLISEKWLLNIWDKCELKNL